nr:MAG TPA: hypothetical protein [Caudoviricetes sp.]
MNCSIAIRSINKIGTISSGCMQIVYPVIIIMTIANNTPAIITSIFLTSVFVHCTFIVPCKNIIIHLPNFCQLFFVHLMNFLCCISFFCVL